jgi:hypothetical protein
MHGQCPAARWLPLRQGGGWPDAQEPVRCFLSATCPKKGSPSDMGRVSAGAVILGIMRR